MLVKISKINRKYKFVGNFNLFDQNDNKKDVEDLGTKFSFENNK
jgi:hypothetical protein